MVLAIFPSNFVDKLYTARLKRALHDCARSPCKDREQIARAMMLPQVHALSQRYLDPLKMAWLVVVDGKTQLA